MLLQMSLAFSIAIGSALLLGPFIIPKLRQLKFGQSIREEGPASHQVKSGTPTMGGVLIIAAFLAPLLFLQIFSMRTLAIVFAFLSFGLVGFVDDYIKVVRKQNLGLRAYQKIIGQLLAGAISAFLIVQTTTSMVIPFIGNRVDLGLWAIPFLIFVFISISNAINLTDGLDGLSSGTTAISTLFFAIYGYQNGFSDGAVVSISLIGACLGFLYFNKYPAKVFMGDTGSLALGGAFGAIAMSMDLTLFIPIAGIIFIAETLSVVIQVYYYKTTKKRVFKMAPLHHHYELCGWKETKVVAVFYLIAFGGVLLSLLIS